MNNYDSEQPSFEKILTSFTEENGDISDSFKQFIDKLPGGFLIYRADHSEKILYANKALINVFRCKTFDEFLVHTNGTFRGLVYPEDLSMVEASITEQISKRGDDLDFVEYRIRCADGEVRWVEDYGHYVNTEKSGGIFYVFISDATDKIRKRITEKNLLLNEEKEQEQKYKSIIEEYDKERTFAKMERLQRLEVIEGLSVNYESILYADLKKDTVFPYRLSSRTEKQFNGKFQEEIFTRFIDDYAESWVHPDDRKAFSEKLNLEYVTARIKEVPTYYVNYRCIENGETKYFQIRIVNVGEGETLRIVLGFKRIDDEIISEIKQKELLTDALNKAQVAEVAKNSFLSNMSHDMRTPLNAIMGYTALMRKNANKPAAIEKYLNKIDEAGNQILNLIERVLEVSYIQTQDFVVNEAECDVTEVISEVYGAILADAKDKNIAVTLRTQSLTHARVFADRDKLKQVLLHVAGNAVKFTKKGGSVTLTATEEPAGDEFATFRFTCEDNGIGIKKNFLKHVFEPFARESSTTSSGKFGAGLGLTIAKYTTELIGGTIDVESDAGKGSKFTITVTLRFSDSDKTDEDADFEETELTGKKILLVEDNLINLEIETEILEDYGFIVDTAENGKIGVDKIASSAEGEYALVLMDIQMPVMNGLEATVAIRNLPNPKLARVPIIALSANALESDRRASIENGMDAHLAKPIDIPVLINTVAKVLSGRTTA